MNPQQKRAPISACVVTLAGGSFAAKCALLNHAMRRLIAVEYPLESPANGGEGPQ
jgi:hypothetical protein